MSTSEMKFQSLTEHKAHWRR